VLGVLAVLAAFLDPLVRFASNHMAADATGGCAQLHGVSIDYGPWPTADRAVTGHLSGLRVAVDEVMIGRLTVSSVHATIGDASYSPWSLVSGGGSVPVHNGRISAVLTPAALQTYLNSKGIPGQINWTPGAAALHIELLGFNIPLYIQVAHGGLSLSLATPARLLLLPLQLVLKVPGVTVEHIALAPQGLEVAAVINGQTARLACAARALLAF
jgi:hypothetical protein